MPKPFVLWVFILGFSVTGTGQKIVDTTIDENSVKIIDRYYSSTLGTQSPIYNGKEYIDYSFTIQEGHPFFQTASFVTGDIFFDGLHFHNIPMLYDLVNARLITQDFQHAYKVELPADKIEQFVLNDHVFVRILSDSYNQLSTGFYDRLYDGKVGLFVKRLKKIIEKSGYQRIDRIIIATNSYYIKKEGIYHSFKNKRDLFNILNDKKKEIREYFSKNKIVYKDDPEKAMLMAVEYYNQLMN